MEQAGRAMNRNNPGLEQSTGLLNHQKGMRSSAELQSKTWIKIANLGALGHVGSHVGVPIVINVASITLDAEAMQIQSIRPGRSTERALIYSHNPKQTACPNVLR